MNRRDVATGYAWNTLLALAAKIVLPVIGILIARHLGPGQMGIFAIIAAVAAVVDIFRDAGLATSFISEKDHSPARNGTYASLALTTGLVLAALTFLLRDVAASSLREPELSWGLSMIALSFAISGLSTIPFAKLQRDARFKEASLLEIATLVVSYGLAIVLAFRGFGYQALVFQVLTRSTLLTGVSFWLAPVPLGTLNVASVLPIWRRSMTIMAGSFVSNLYTLADNLLIARLFGSKSVGYYATAFNVAMKPVELISWPLSRTMFVAFSRAQEEPERLKHIFYKSLTAAAFFTLPIYAFLLTSARDLLLALYGDRFEPSGPLLVILAVYLGTRSVGTLCGSLLVSIGRPGLGNATWIAAYGVAATGIWTQRATLSLEGTVGWLTAGASSAYVLTTILAFWCVRPEVKHLQNFARVATVAASAYAIGALSHQFDVNPLARLLVTSGLVGVLSLVLAGLLFFAQPLACASKAGVRRCWDRL